jgi:uroporphyrinogen-III synthase
MRILITRPKEDGESLANHLSKMGHTCILCPLIKIVPRATVAVPDHAYQAICLTSANGIISAPKFLDRRTPVFGVGPQSAAAATAKGFTNVSFHGGDVDGLVDFISNHCRPELGPMLYLSGTVTSGDLEGKLRAQGFNVFRIMAYDAIAMHPNEIDETLLKIDAVVLYSKRTAKIWQDLISAANLTDEAAKITSLCLSQKVASSLPQSWAKRTATTPDEAAMLRLIDSLT